MGFLPTAVDIMVIWTKFPIPIHFIWLIPKMLMFILTVSCLTTSSFLWFMDLTFQIPTQYCSLQHLILLWTPDTSTTENFIHFGLAASFIQGLLVILLLSFPGTYWTPSDLGDSSFGVISFWHFIQFMRFLQQVYGVFCHSFLQWITFCQNSLLWPVSLWWPCIVWLIASLSYTSPVTTRQRSMKWGCFMAWPKTKQNRKHHENANSAENASGYVKKPFFFF